MMSNLCRHNHVKKIVETITQKTTINFIEIDKPPLNMNGLIRTAMVPDIPRKINNKTNNSTLTLTFQSRNNLSTTLTISHAIIDVISAIIVQKIDTRATLGKNSAKDEWKLNPSQRYKTSPMRYNEKTTKNRRKTFQHDTSLLFIEGISSYILTLKILWINDINYNISFEY